MTQMKFIRMLRSAQLTDRD